MLMIVVVLAAWLVLGGVFAAALSRTLRVRDRHDGRRRSALVPPAPLPRGPVLPAR